jgi:hypothetical protein
MDELNQARFCCKFNRKDGDVRCIAHIYNIAVQAGKHFTYNTIDKLAFEFLAAPSIFTGRARYLNANLSTILKLICPLFSSQSN